MGILTRATAEPAADTPESLRNELVDASTEFARACEDAGIIFAGVKESVVQRATDRVRAVGDLLADLTAEKNALDEILTNAGESV